MINTWVCVLKKCNQDYIIRREDRDACATKRAQQAVAAGAFDKVVEIPQRSGGKPNGIRQGRGTEQCQD